MTLNLILFSFPPLIEVILLSESSCYKAGFFALNSQSGQLVMGSLPIFRQTLELKLVKILSR